MPALGSRSMPSLRLRKVMIKTAGKIGIDHDKLKPFLLKPLFTRK